MISKLARTLLGAAIDGFSRFPLTALALLTIAVLADLEIADVLELPNALQYKINSALAAFALASLAKQIGIESYGFGKPYQYLAAMVAGAAAAALMWFAKDVGVSEIAFFAALVGALLTAAHWFRGTSDGFWFYVVRLLFAIGLSFVAVIVFSIGASAIFASLDYLFGIDVSSKIYIYLGN